jgi:hypothetical protein
MRLAPEAQAAVAAGSGLDEDPRSIVHEMMLSWMTAYS